MLDGSTETLLGEALRLLVSALELLDRAEARGDIGAHVDMARERLLEFLDLCRGSGSQPHPEAGHR